ncbi:MAG: VWA domain-containing protein [Saprospiraceae bacterium]
MIVEWLERLAWREPLWLILLGLLPFLWIYSRRNVMLTDHVIAIPNINPKFIQKTWRTKLLSVLPMITLLGLGCLILAMARPQWVLKEEKQIGEGINIFLAMDLSSSMLSQDFTPNRMEVSKAVAIEFIEKRKFDKIGIVAFSGEGFTHCPLTVDHVILKQLLSELQCGFLEDGTAIGLGLATAINRLKDDSAKSKIIILITDGVNNAGDISPQLAMDLAKTFGIKIYAIGVGTNGQAYSPIGRRPDGEYIFGMAPVTIDESLLNHLSQETGGKYYRATSKTELEKIYAEIDRLEKTKIEIRTFKRYSEEFRPFLLLGILLLMCTFLIKKILITNLP